MRQYEVKFDNGDSIVFETPRTLTKSEAFSEAKEIAPEHGINGKPVSFVDQTVRIIRENQRKERSARKMLKNVKLRVPTEAQEV